MKTRSERNESMGSQRGNSLSIGQEKKISKETSKEVLMIKSRAKVKIGGKCRGLHQIGTKWCWKGTRKKTSPNAGERRKENKMEL